MTEPPTSQVRVGVRIRPLSSSEISQGGQDVVRCCNVNKTIEIAQRKFTYDAVFDAAVNQSDLHESVARPMLESFLDGYNATIMAYGQTGSGKTFTMGSEAHNEEGGCTNTDGGNVGLIPRFMSEIFVTLEKQMSDDSAYTDGDFEEKQRCTSSRLTGFQVSASFLEVYGEDVHDLLDDERKVLPLREDATGGVIVVGLTSRTVRNAIDALDVLHIGTLNRTTAATLMNHQSSRSHAVFIVSLKQTSRGSGGVDVTASSRFTFVDLAGSERLKKTGAEGERAREGIKINEGLLALGNVINALADDERLARGEKVHVPYRQSKLTRLLQDALGGNSQTLFLACVSPSDRNANETLSALNYANRARNIKNAPTKNVDSTLVEIQRLHALTEILECELVKERFLAQKDHSPDDSEEGAQQVGKDLNQIGQASIELFKRHDVQEYMKVLYNMAEEKRGSVLSKGKDMRLLNSKNNKDLALTPNNNQEKKTHSNSSNITKQHLLSGTISPLRGQRAMSPIRGQASNFAKHSPRRKVTPMNRVRSSAFTPEELDIELVEMNPDEDMAILDQLLELQHQDSEFDKVQKVDQQNLERVEGELEEQEGLLLQLKESLKVYHSMKDKYEVLMGDVQSLETEKAVLASELERAQVDPTKGCSIAIKKKLERVESNLCRARKETRKHQQMYRKAEQEAQKCRALERKIMELKQGKVNLVRKQREAAAKHKEYTEAKTREIQILKRKERKTGHQMSKLQAECQKYKATLERRKQHSDKLSNKLKQTESHLMSLLAMRKNKLRAKKKLMTRSSRYSTAAEGAGKMDDKQNAFAPMTEEVSSIKFLLDNLVSDRVQLSQLKHRYEERVSEYSDLMRQLTEEMKNLKSVKENAGIESDSDSVALQAEYEQNIEEVELNLELVGADLEEIRSKLPRGLVDEGHGQDFEPKSESSALKMVSNMDAPVARTMLWEILDLVTLSQFERKTMEESIKRKDSAIQSFEDEVDAQTKKIKALSSELRQRRQLSAQEGNEDPFETIRKINIQMVALKKDLEYSNEERAKSAQRLKDVTKQLEEKSKETAVMKEKVTIAEVMMTKFKGSQEVKMILDNLQSTWNELGFSANDREAARQQISRCLENTINQSLETAKGLKNKTRGDIDDLNGRLVAIYNALGLDDRLRDLDKTKFDGMDLYQQIEALQEMIRRMQPMYQSAVERRYKLITELEALEKTMEPLDDKISKNLLMMRQYKRKGGKRRRPHHSILKPNVDSSKERRAKISKNVEGMMKELELCEATARGLKLEEIEVANNQDNKEKDIVTAESEEENIDEPPNSLSESFLDICEIDLKKLRLIKSEKLVANSEVQNRIWNLAKEMNLSERDIISLVIQSMKKRFKEFPTWWDPVIANEVFRNASMKDGTVAVTKIFTQHLVLVHECLQNISHSRSVLSQSLKGIVESAYETLLTALEDVDGEMYASEAYASFHDALFQLPPMSKEHIEACIDEMNNLVTAVNIMSESEIEALTFVWDAVNIPSGQREYFWNVLKDTKTFTQATGENSFNDVLRFSPAGVEEWVKSAVKDTAKIQGQLNVCLLKLKKIHEEVERQRSKQDARSKIIAFDAQVRILVAKLADFEEKASGKHRLLTKKVNSSNLLREEKFRKQMQSKFSSKLAILGKLLQDWEKQEGCSFEANMLSDDVRVLINSDRADSWVEKRTAFMHLGTTTMQNTKKSPENAIGKETETDSTETLFGDNTSKHIGAGDTTPKKLKAVKNLRGPASPNIRRMKSVPGKKKYPQSNHHEQSPRKNLGKSKKIHKSHRHAKISLSQSNDSSTPKGKNVGFLHDERKRIDTSANAEGRTLLPFGHLLAKSPSIKEMKENKKPC